MSNQDKQIIKSIKRAKRTPMFIKKRRLAKAAKQIDKAFGYK